MAGKADFMKREAELEEKIAERKPPVQVPFRILLFSFFSPCLKTILYFLFCLLFLEKYSCAFCSITSNNTVRYLIQGSVAIANNTNSMMHSLDTQVIANRSLKKRAVNAIPMMHPIITLFLYLLSGKRVVQRAMRRLRKVVQSLQTASSWSRFHCFSQKG